MEAEVLAARLRAFGINAELPDRYTASNNPFLTPALGGIRVMVADEDLEEALRILNEPIVINGGTDEDDEKCPKCGSTSIEPNRPSHSFLDAFVSIVVGALFVVRRPRMKCQKCGNVFRSGESDSFSLTENLVFGIALVLAAVVVYFWLQDLLPLK